ncbi:MAG: NifB/NifX family molybdenum-iron cluster-binding protein [Desulfofundulus sp.]|uniref:NifB/NifX family molybdenum-iron cluster-binding protein n=1 Tax=Desulfofundulus sp. TaxID=2282750 RepID=UPI003C76DA69
MKLAIPNANGFVKQHFGKSKEFIIFDISDREIKGHKLLSTAPFQHNYEELAKLLVREGVDTLILGSAGLRAIQILQQHGLKVITGASGSVREAAIAYARGAHLRHTPFNSVNPKHVLSR